MRVTFIGPWRWSVSPNVAVLWSLVKHLLREHARGIYLKIIRPRVSHGFGHQPFTDALAAVLSVHLSVVDRDQFVRAAICHLGSPFTIFFYEKSTILPVLVSFNVHGISVQTNRRSWQMLF